MELIFNQLAFSRGSCSSACLNTNGNEGYSRPRGGVNTDMELGRSHCRIYSFMAWKTQAPAQNYNDPLADRLTVSYHSQELLQFPCYLALQAALCPPPAASKLCGVKWITEITGKHLIAASQSHKKYPFLKLDLCSGN